MRIRVEYSDSMRKIIFGRLSQCVCVSIFEVTLHIKPIHSCFGASSGLEVSSPFYDVSVRRGRTKANRSRIGSCEDVLQHSPL